MKGAVWITWESQRRNRELSRALGIRLHEWDELDRIGNPLDKYARGLAMTARLVMREKPGVVFCQNPSLILSSFLVAIRRRAGLTVCVDAHNAGLFPMEGRSRPLGMLSRFVQRGADLTIVTNAGLACHVEKNGGRPFILPDRIPDIPMAAPVKLPGKRNILFICSYAEDEPYQLVFEAAKGLGRDVCIHVTGNFRKKGIDPGSVPSNVHLMGYIPEYLYAGMLRSVDATLDLTTRDDCLVCGAYETVAVEKPQVLSDTKALRTYFSKGAVYASHSAGSLRDAIMEALENKAVLEEEARELKRERQAQWERSREALVRQVEKLTGRPWGMG